MLFPYQSLATTASFLKDPILLTHLMRGSPAQAGVAQQELLSPKVVLFPVKQHRSLSSTCKIHCFLLVVKRCVPICMKKTQSICKVKQISLWTSAVRAQNAGRKGKVRKLSSYKGI